MGMAWFVLYHFLNPLCLAREGIFQASMMKCKNLFYILYYGYNIHIFALNVWIRNVSGSKIHTSSYNNKLIYEILLKEITMKFVDFPWEICKISLSFRDLLKSWISMH